MSRPSAPLSQYRGRAPALEMCEPKCVLPNRTQDTPDDDQEMSDAAVPGNPLPAVTGAYQGPAPPAAHEDGAPAAAPAGSAQGYPYPPQPTYHPGAYYQAPAVMVPSAAPWYPPGPSSSHAISSAST